MWPPSLRKDKTASQNLASGALSFTTNFARRTKINSVYLKATVSITETVKVTLKSALGSAYDSLLASVDLVGERDFIFRPEGDLSLQAGDEILTECTNANTTGTVKAVVKSSEILQ